MGGNVQTLLGNHEMMNLDGQYRYVAKDELQRLTKDLDLQTQDAEQLTQEGLRLWQRLLQPVLSNLSYPSSSSQAIRLIFTVLEHIAILERDSKELLTRQILCILPLSNSST